MPADSIVADLLRARPDQAEAAKFERFLVDAYTGGGGYRGRIKKPDLSPEGVAYSGIYSETTYLDQFGREDAEKFQKRQACAHYTNYCRPTTNLKASYLLRKGWRYTSEPEKLTEWRKRTRFESGHSKRVQLACVLGYLPVSVDLPAVPDDARSLADAPKGDPYVTSMLPIQLLDYDVDDAGELTFAKTMVRTEVRATWRDAVPAIVTLVTLWTREDFQVWKVVEGAGESTAEVLREGPHSFGRVPVVSWKAAENVDDPVRGDSVMADVAILNRRIFNIESEQMEHVRSQVFALLLLPRAHVERLPDETDAAYALRAGLDIGTDNALCFDPEQTNIPSFIAPPGDVAKTYKELRNDAVIELCRVARVEFERASGTDSSAQSKQQNFEPTNLAVADIAKSLAHGIRETLVLVGRALGCSEEELAAFDVSAHDSYASDDLKTDLEMAAALLSDPAYGPEFNATMRKQVVRTVLPGLGADALKVIDAQIDEKANAAELEADTLKEREADNHDAQMKQLNTELNPEDDAP